LGVLASVAAFTEGRPWLDAALGQLDENRALLAGLLREHLPAVGYAQPQASFLAWLDCRALGLGGDPSAAFPDRGRVALRRGPGWGGRARLAPWWDGRPWGGPSGRRSRCPPGTGAGPPARRRSGRRPPRRRGTPPPGPGPPSVPPPPARPRTP